MANRLQGSCPEEDRKVMFESEDAFVDRRRRDKRTSTDHISMLPDELLVFILSLLTLRESVATSLLSRRWRYLWTLMPKLDFDAKKSLLKVEMAENGKLVTDEEKSTKYIQWVDHVIALHKSCAIEDFRVCFNFSKPYEKYIDNWVNYALARKVKRLELSLTYKGYDSLFPPSDDIYTFPYHFLPTYKENCSNDSQSHCMKQCNSMHFKFLEKISMHSVSVSGEALEFFLSNCPLLQHFGKSLQQFLLKNVPLLVEIKISGDIEMKDILLMFSSILPQLEKFNYRLNSLLCWEVTGMFYSAVKMSNLKQLRLRLIFDDSLLPLTNMLRTSPCLETFVLEIFFARKFRKRELENVEGSYAHLKEVKIRGYCGSIGNLEFVMHLSESAGALEKIVIDPRKPSDFNAYLTNYSRHKDKYLRRVQKARAQAKKQLLGILPPRINLQIL
ncbi:hypothetical protein ACS0TY_035727 [Phlomoides rotata]